VASVEIGENNAASAVLQSMFVPSPVLVASIADGLANTEVFVNSGLGAAAAETIANNAQLLPLEEG